MQLVVDLSHRKGLWQDIGLFVAGAVVLAAGGGSIVFKRSADARAKYLATQKADYAEYIAWNKWHDPNEKAYVLFSAALDEYKSVDPRTAPLSQVHSGYHNLLLAEHGFTKTPRPIVPPGTTVLEREHDLFQRLKDQETAAGQLANFTASDRVFVRQKLLNEFRNDVRYSFISQQESTLGAAYSAASKVAPFPSVSQRAIIVAVRKAVDQSTKAHIEHLSDDALKSYLYRSTYKSEQQAIDHERSMIRAGLHEPQSIPDDMDMAFAKELYFQVKK